MQFDLIYDIRAEGCRDGFLAVYGIALMLVCAVAWMRNRRLRGLHPPTAGWPEPPGWPRWGFAFFGVYTLVAFTATWAQYWNLRRDISEGRAESLEGNVTAFQPAPTYKETESFRVGDQEFSYMRLETSQGFHTLAADGGPIRDGLHVRMLYVGNHILRLEVARPTESARN